MRISRNVTQGLIAFFEEYNFNLITMLQNYIADSLVTYAIDFKAPMHPSGRYEIKVIQGPSILDNIKIWKYFEDNKDIQNFLTLTKEFYGLSIDEENEFLEKDTTNTDCCSQRNTVRGGCCSC